MGAARLPIGTAADWLTNPTADLPEIVRRSSFARGMARRSHVRTRLPDASNIRCRNVIRDTPDLNGASILANQSANSSNLSQLITSLSSNVLLHTNFRRANSLNNCQKWVD
jgi:hypothetical protein